MRKVLSIYIFVTLVLVSYGQIQQIDLNDIKSISNTYKFDKLYQRFLINDTTLSLEDYTIIYYGQAFKDNYNSSARHDSVRALNMYLNTSINPIDFRKVLNYTKQILNEFPFNIEQIYITGVAYDKIGELDLSRLWFYKYDKLINTIMSSGDGKSKKSAFIVTKITDEYSILNALGLNFNGQSITRKKKKYYDLMNVSPNDLGIDKLYFDINLFFGKWKTIKKTTANTQYSKKR